MTNFLIRSLDIVFSAIGLVVLLPLIAFLFIIGLIDTGSPLFIQTRVGRYQKPFRLIKFRTMSIDTKSVATHLACTSSITTLGGFLRKTKLDELPQLYNVLIGQMSLVGPRPCLFNQIQLIEERAKRNIFNARPGITGLGQINNVDMSMPRKLARYDKITVAKSGLMFYFMNIFGTVIGRGQGDNITRGTNKNVKLTSSG